MCPKSSLHFHPDSRTASLHYAIQDTQGIDASSFARRAGHDSEQSSPSFRTAAESEITTLPSTDSTPPSRVSPSNTTPTPARHIGDQVRATVAVHSVVSPLQNTISGDFRPGDETSNPRSASNQLDLSSTTASDATAQLAPEASDDGDSQATATPWDRFAALLKEPPDDLDKARE